MSERIGRIEQNGSRKVGNRAIPASHFSQRISTGEIGIRVVWI
jgi:hypothetical protein